AGGHRLVGGRVVHAAIVLLQLGVGVGAGRLEGPAVVGLEVDVGLGAVDAGVAGVADLGEGVQPQGRELDVVPVVHEQGAVEPQPVVQPGGLPADLVVHQPVGRIGRDGAPAVDAAGPEAG